MIAKKAQIARIQTLVDGTPRLVVDLEGVTSEEFGELYALRTNGIINVIIHTDEELKQVKENQDGH